MDNLRIDVEFPIDNPRLKNEAQQAKNIISGVGDTASESAARANANVTSLITKQSAEYSKLEKNILQLKINMDYYRTAAEKSLDPAVIEKYNLKVKEIAAEISRIRNMGLSPKTPDLGLDTQDKQVRRVTSSWNGLSNSVNQITRELPAFTYSAQTGFMAISNNIPILVDEINRLKNANLQLTASGQKAPSVWKQLASSFFSWQTLMTVGITLLTVYGKEIGNFITSLFKGKAQIDAAKESFLALNKALAGTEYKKAVMNILELKTNIDLAKKGFLDKKDVLDQYNKTIGTTTGQLDSLDQVEKRIIEQGDAYIQTTLLKAAAQIALEEAAKKAYEAELVRRKKDEEFSSAIVQGNQGGTSMFGVSGGSYVNAQSAKQQEALAAEGRRRRKEQAAKEVDEAKKVQEDIARKFQTDAAKLSEKYGFDFFGKAGEKEKDAEKNAAKAQQRIKQAQQEYNTIVKLQEEMQEKAKQLDDDYSKKSFSKDEEEKQALKNKFAAFMQIIADANKKISEYNSKHSTKVGLIDTSGIDGLQKRAEKDLEYRQQTDTLKEELNKQQKLYEDFENARIKLGEEKAKELYKVQFSSFGVYLSNQAANVNPADAGSGPVAERTKLFADAMEKETDVQAKHFVKLLEDFQGYEAQRKALTENYERDRAALLAKGKTDEASTLTFRYAEDLNTLDDTNVKKLDSYKKLFDGIERISDKQAQVVIANAESMLQGLQSKGLISADLAKEILDKINDSKKAVADRLPERLDAAADSLRNVASAISSIDVGFANILGTVSNVVAGFSEMQKQKEAMNAPGASGSEKLLAGAGMVSAGIGIAASVIGTGVSWFKGLKAAKEKAKKDIQDFYDSAYRGEMQYQATLRDRARQQAEQHRDTMQGLKDEYALLNSQQTAIDQKYAEVYRKLQGEQYVESTTYKHGTWFRKAKSEQNMASLAGMNYDQLEELFLQGKLTDSAKSLFEWLQKLKEEGGDVTDTLKEVADAANELYTGTNVDSLTDGFMNMLKEGKTSVQDLADFFQDSMDDAALHMFQNNILKKKIEGFYETFAAAGSDGLTSDDIEALRVAYQAMTGEALAEFEKLKQVTGSSFKNANASAVSKGIQSITSDQASALEGITRGTYDYTKRNYQTGQDQLAMMKSQMMVLQKIENNTALSADRLSGLDKLAKLDDIIAELQKGNKNTLRGAGLG